MTAEQAFTLVAIAAVIFTQIVHLFWLARHGRQIRAVQEALARRVLAHAWEAHRRSNLGWADVNELGDMVCLGWLALDEIEPPDLRDRIASSAAAAARLRVADAR